MGDNYTLRDFYYKCLFLSANFRQSEWTESIAVGSESFIEEIKEKLNVRAKGRKAIKAGTAFQLKEPGYVAILPFWASKRRILAMKTPIPGTVTQCFQVDSMVRPQTPPNAKLHSIRHESNH